MRKDLTMLICATFLLTACGDDDGQSADAGAHTDALIEASIDAPSEGPSDAAMDAVIEDSPAAIDSGPDTGLVLGDPRTSTSITRWCVTYCEQVTRACSGSYAQYASESDCEQICVRAPWPLGASMYSREDSIWCRYQRALGAINDPARLCDDAGPYSPYCAHGQPL